MSGTIDFEDHIDEQYRIHDINSLSLDEARSLLIKAVRELKDTRNEFDEFQCK